MRIPLRSDWESRISGQAKVYPLGSRDRKIIDGTFDELQQQQRLKYTTHATPFSYPVFVIWRNLPNRERKGRVVVDIHGLNHLVILDADPLLLQADIIALCRGCLFISAMDATSFFYQWRVYPELQYALTVITHQGQETFQVTVMGFRNSPAYCQRQMDILLQEMSTFAKAYVDDTIIASENLQHYLHHLRVVFEAFSLINTRTW